MNILHTVFSFNNGGIENLIVDMLNNWNIDSDNLVLCIINNDYNEELINKIKQKKNIKVILLNRDKGSKSFEFIIKYIDVIRKNKINVIHCHLFEAVKVSTLAKIFIPNIKIFYTVHDTNIYKKFSKKDIIIDNLFVKGIIAISNSVKAEIKSKNKVEVIYNAIDIDKFSNRIKEKHNINSINVGCVARIMPEKKGQDILLKAIAIVKDKYPNIMCYFAGEPQKGKEYYLDELKNYCKKLGITENVVFMGNVGDVPQFLQKLDIFVLPSRYEGFGIVILEAMASKVPVIASRLEGPEEIIKNDKYGKLFEVENHTELAKLIIEEIEFKNTNKINLAYEYVNKEFNIGTINKKLRQVYLT